MLTYLLEIRDGWAYWRFYDFEEDDSVLAACRESEINRFFEAHSERFKLRLNP